MKKNYLRNKTAALLAAVFTALPSLTGLARTELQQDMGAAMSTYTAYPLYDEVIGQYAAAMEAGWDAAQFADKDLCYLAAYLPSSADLGYFVKDLDDDGIEELMIGQTDPAGYTGMFYELYTRKDDVLLKLAGSTERDRYYLCEDNLITEEGSSGAAHSFTAHYELLNQELVFLDAVIYDGDYDAENPWFYTDTDSTLEDRSSPVSEAQATAIMDRYPDTPIYFTPIQAGALSDLQLQALAEVNDITGRSALLKNKIRNASTQTDMNLYATELYQLWDAELNILWSYFQITLPSEEMDALIAEEIAWIEDKEYAAQVAGSIYEDSTMQSFAESQEAALWTEDRVHVLLKRFLAG